MGQFLILDAHDPSSHKTLPTGHPFWESHSDAFLWHYIFGHLTGKSVGHDSNP